MSKDNLSFISFPKPSELLNDYPKRENNNLEIKKYTKNQLDQTNLEVLINSSFGGRLLNNYFSKLAKDVDFYMPSSGNYEAVGIVKKFNKIGYMDKLAVSPYYSNQGLGDSLLNAIIEDNPRGLFWRANIQNKELIEWYTLKADRIKKVGNWAVFFKNIHDRNEKQCLNYAKDLKPSIIY